MTLETVRDGTHRVTISKRVVIRAARIDDLPTMSAMWGPERRHSQKRLLRRYFDEQRADVQRGLVADFNGHVVGQLWSRYRHIDRRIADGLDAVYMHTLFVVSPFRRLGIAAALTKTTSREAVERGVDVLTIGVDRPNTEARRLYEKWGFRVYYQISDLSGDLVFLRRPVF